MLRNTLAVIAGAIAWMVGFFVLARLFFFVWPAYAIPARTWMTERRFEFIVRAASAYGGESAVLCCQVSATTGRGGA